MNLLAKLFSKMPSVQELEDKIKEIKLDQKKKQRDLIMLDQAKQEKIKRAVEAKKAGRQEIVKDIFRDLSQIEIDIRNANSDLRRLSLAKTALLSFVRKAEMLEKKKDKKSLQKLVSRFNNSSIQKTIDSASVDDDTFNSMLEDVLGEEEDAAVRLKIREDAGFADFEKAIGEMAKTDDAGAMEEDLSEPSRSDAMPETGRPLSHLSRNFRDRGAVEDSGSGDTDVPSKGGENSRSGGANAGLRYQEVAPGEQRPWAGEVQRSQEQDFVTQKLRQIRDVRQKIFAMQPQGQDVRSQQDFVTQKLRQIRDVRQKIFAMQPQGQDVRSQQDFVTQKLRQIRDVRQKIFAMQPQGQDVRSQQDFVTQKLRQIRDVRQKIFAMQPQGQDVRSQQDFVTQKLRQIRDVRQKIFAMQPQGQDVRSQQDFVTQKLRQIRDVKQKIFAIQRQGQ